MRCLLQNYGLGANSAARQHVHQKGAAGPAPVHAIIQAEYVRGPASAP